MHDGMAQVLAYVNTKAQAVKEFLRQGRAEEAAAQLEQLAAAAREVYSDVREGILALRTPMGPDRSLAEALRGFLERWEEQSGISSELTMDRDVCLPPGHELQLLRIVQEALSNIRKHSGAGSAWVELRHADRELRVRIEDDGSGFDPQARTGSGLPRFGMAIMRERAQAIGGSLHIESAPGRGTRVSVEIPLTSENP
jgi:signal transduction histidine kinase